MFALGVVLYELIAKQRPWELPAKPSVEGYRKCALEGQARPLGSVVPDVEPAVGQLVGKLLATEAADRPSAQEACELVREIIRRRQRRRWLKKWAPAIVSVVLLLCGSTWFVGRNLWIKNQRLSSETAYRKVVAHLGQPGIDPAAYVLQALPTKAIVRHDTDAWKAALIKAKTHWFLTRDPAENLAGGARHVASDAALGTHLVENHDGSTALVRDGQAGTPIPPDLSRQPVDLAVFCPHRTLVAAKLESGDVFVWDFDAGTTYQLATLSRDSRALAFSPDGSMLACGSTVEFDTTTGRKGTRGVVNVWRVGRWGREAFSLQSAPSDAAPPVGSMPVCRSVDQLAWSPDGLLLATVGRDSLNVFVWNCQGDASREVPRRSFYHQATVSSISWNPQSLMPLLATGRADGIISIWDDRGSPNRTEPPILCGGEELANRPAVAAGSSGNRMTVEHIVWIPGGAEVMAIHRSGDVFAWPLWNPSTASRQFSLGVFRRECRLARRC